MSTNQVYYDELEQRAPERREAELFAALSAQVAQAQREAPAWARILKDIDPGSLRTRAGLAQVPVMRKAALPAVQRDDPPLGGLATVAAGTLARIFASPGPIYEPEARRPDYWRFARALFAAGFRRGELMHNAFSYHFTPAGAMLESAAHALGCAVFPAGVGQTELQVGAIAHLRPHGYGGTPSFLRILLERGRETGADLSSLRKALVSAEPLPASLRAAINAFGVAVLQCYGSADVGLIAYESPAMDGLIVDEGVIVEIVRPGSDEVVPDGEVGEVVVTVLNAEYPLLRLATGDLSAILPGMSPCGRTNQRICGWLGRADQAAKVRGLFVYPTQVGEVVKRHPEIVKARLVLDRRDDTDLMTLRCEVDGAAPPGLGEAVVGTLRQVLKLRGTVEFQPPGSLPADGKTIDDRRRFD